MYSSNDILDFYTLFKGNESAYGVTKVGDMVNGKAEAQSFLKHEEITPAVIQRHLQGEESIGIAPIKSSGTCSFGAIDIDNYKYDLLDIVKAIEDFNLPLVPCWSKSKKLHLYIFFEDEAPADEVIKLLQWYVRAFALDKKTEVFPKQSKTNSTNTFYSWINIPYFNAEDESNHRKIVKGDGTLITSLPEALSYIKTKWFTLKDHKAFIDDFEYKDAPPCILSGLLLRDIGPGQRNNWLFSVGVYFKLKDENCDLRTLLTDVNHSLHNPIPDAELEATIIKYYAKWMDDYRRTPEFAFTNDWHIVYLDDKLQYNPTPSKPANGDCIYGIEGAIEVLKNYKQYNDSIVALNLKYIIHMVADMHCPAHIKYEGRDQNHFVTFTDYYKKKKKLKIHFVWDAAAIQETRIFSSTEWAREIDIYSKKEIKEFCKGTPREWLHSNAVRCLKQFDLAYPDAEIGQDFLNEAMPFIEEQLAIAGYRMAHLLNELF